MLENLGWDCTAGFLMKTEPCNDSNVITDNKW